MSRTGTSSAMVLSSSMVSGWRNRLWVALAAVTVAVSIAGFYAVRLVERNVQEHISAHLRLILAGTSMMLEAGVDALAFQAQALSLNDDVKADVSRTALDASAAMLLIDRLARLTDHPKTLALVVTDRSLGVVAATDDRYAAAMHGFEFGDEASPDGLSIDERVSLPQLLESIPGEAGEDAPLVMAVVIPLVDMNGIPRFDLWLMHDARRLFASVLQPGRSGTTGEIYAFDKNGVMISDSRFDEHLYDIGLLERGQLASRRIVLRDPLVDLTQGGRSPRVRSTLPFTKAVTSAIRGEEAEDVGGFRDYRGIPVVGAWRWYPQYGFGITHEVDVAEAYYNVKILILVVLGMVGLLLAATLGSAVFSWRASVAESLRKQTELRLKELRGEMAHVSRLATMGEMATSLAHEINQPLAAISNYARATLNDLDTAQIDGDGVRERLVQIERNALRSGEVIYRLRKFVSRREVTTAPVAVDQLVQDPLKLMSNDLKGLSVALSVDVQQGLPAVMVDEIQVQQVILNLVRNSVDAMRKTPGRDHRLSVRAYRETGELRRVCVDVGDTGPGLDAGIKERLFEQFNSSSSQGMGMGLAISRTIVESHGGELALSRDTKEGATFTVRLPAA